ncbi:MAG: HNH endonuclease [Candidatus Heimdallarchaeaceae archaeon]
MPPPAVKTIKELIFWQYAKIISESAGFGKKQYAFIMNRFKKLCSNEISWSSSIEEYLKEREQSDCCIYCGAKGDLTLEHILPKSRGGPDIPENAIMVCKHCNSSKGNKRLYEWFSLENRDNIPRIAEGKYLKLLFKMHNQLGTLNIDEVAILCPHCDLSTKCPEKAKLSVYCLEGIFDKRNNNLKNLFTKLK